MCFMWLGSVLDMVRYWAGERGSFVCDESGTFLQNNKCMQSYHS